ncbi:hypothetical protein EON63_09610 [archaeon]|nr:MAG: hypothetical protein EON63_09610 [archaeon]
MCLQTDVSTWEGMQKEAEEKDKQYCCLVYTHHPVTSRDLDRLLAMDRRDRDGEGRECLQVHECFCKLFLYVCVWTVSGICACLVCVTNSYMYEQAYVMYCPYTYPYFTHSLFIYVYFW